MDSKPKRDRLEGLIDIGEELLRLFIIRPILSWRRWRCTRAKQYLLHNDPTYRRHYVEDEVVRRRNHLYNQGISPVDPSVPDSWSVSEELPPLRWPQKEYF
jgi:hypothetical protein